METTLKEESPDEIIDSKWEAYRYIKECKESLHRLLEAGQNNSYPVILLPSSLNQLIRNLDDPKSDEYTEIGKITTRPLSFSSFTIADMMNFIIENGSDSNTIRNDWNKYKETIPEPRLREPIKKEARKNKASKEKIDHIKTKIYHPNLAFIFVFVFLILILIGQIAMMANTDKVVSGDDIIGIAIICFLFWGLPTFLLLKVCGGTPVFIEQIEKNVWVQKSKDEIDRDTKLYEELYLKQQKQFEEEYEAEKALEIKRFEEQKKKYPKLIEERHMYWGNLPSLINDSIEYAFWNYVYKHYVSDVEYKIVDQKEVPQRGSQEDKFFYELMKSDIVGIKTDVSANGFYPDIAIIEGDTFIDIEIDEPYEYRNKLLIHYIGCGDEKRNKKFQDDGAFVIRFSEQQIKKHIKSCVELVRAAQKFADDCNLDSLNFLLDLQSALFQKRWTIEEARVMKIENYRDK